MRINVYSQELTDEVIPVEKVSNTGRVYRAAQLILHSSDRLHHPPEDDDRSAVTFWFPSSLKRNLDMAEAFNQIAELFEHEANRIREKHSVVDEFEQARLDELIAQRGPVIFEATHAPTVERPTEEGDDPRIYPQRTDVGTRYEQYRSPNLLLDGAPEGWHIERDAKQNPTGYLIKTEDGTRKWHTDKVFAEFLKG